MGLVYQKCSSPRENLLACGWWAGASHSLLAQNYLKISIELMTYWSFEFLEHIHVLGFTVLIR